MTKPVTKVGTEMSSSETTRMTESYHLPFFRPENDAEDHAEDRLETETP